VDLTPKNSVLTLRRYLSGASNAQTRADSAAVDAVWSCRTRFTHSHSVGGNFASHWLTFMVPAGPAIEGSLSKEGSRAERLHNGSRVLPPHS